MGPLTPGVRVAAALAALALSLAAGSARAERVVRMDVALVVEADSALRVREDILYDFEGERRHGIFRDVPVRYARRGG
ncbi:MAG TPA: DUF2207 domain-containing protein, partial [Myxococcota bacterium]|nr:DUF2207 domain-containing protein [Myxococcota bacterium]